MEPSVPKKSRELPTEHLATTDQDGHRVYLYPADVTGTYRTFRSIVQVGLILFFLVLPWIKIAGHHAVLLDIPRRRFAFFGLTFWAHDIPPVFFLFFGAALTLGFVTALWGRIWCGWACPQTVFIDGVFRRIELWIEGDALTRRRVDQGPLTLKKFTQKSIKWALFLVVSLVLTHSFLAYFVGADALPGMMTHSPSENWTPFVVMGVLTGVVLFDFGWFREQFCTVLCPYARFQTVLMDEASLTVSYDVARGEPRRGLTPEAQAMLPQIPYDKEKKEGDCVNCYKCVQVCPTGIDIRRGTQLECIACTACVDACDEVMSRLGRAKGLIRYASLSELLKNPRTARIRPWVYAGLAALAGLGLVTVLFLKKEVAITLVRPADVPYSVIQKQNGPDEIINRFALKLHNESFEKRWIRVQVADSTQAQTIRIVTAIHPIPLEPGESKRVDLFIEFPKSLLPSTGKMPSSIRFDMVPGANSSLKEPKEADVQEVTFVGPES